MLKPVLGIIGVAKDASTITLRDVTGVYDVTTNPGGYGTPNAPVPITVGLTFKNWTDTLPYANIVGGAGCNTLSDLATGIQDGYTFSQSILGLPGTFRGGVQQVKYYPYEALDSIVTLTQGSKLVTVTAGTIPTAYNAGYISVLILSADGMQVLSTVLLIDKTQPITSTTFYVDQPWGGITGTGYKLMIATEGDLKILIDQLANACLSGKIGQLSLRQNCDTDYIDTLTTLTMWMFSAKVKFDGQDFAGADELIEDIQDRCFLCDQTCNICCT